MDTERAQKPKRPWAKAFSLAVLAAIVLVIYLLGRSYYYAAFGSDKYYLALSGSGTARDEDVILEIDTPNHYVSAFLDPAKTDQMLKLFETAKARRSFDWREVGSLKEDMPDWFGPSLLTVSAGPGIRFIIHDHGTCVSFDLAPRDFAAFERAARRAHQHFNGDAADRGLTATLDPPESAFQRGNKAADPIPQIFPGCR